MLMSLVKKNDEILFVFLRQLLVRLINSNVAHLHYFKLLFWKSGFYKINILFHNILTSQLHL